jgi:hypothetical protein
MGHPAVKVLMQESRNCKILGYLLFGVGPYCCHYTDIMAPTTLWDSWNKRSGTGSATMGSRNAFSVYLGLGTAFRCVQATLTSEVTSAI